MPRPSLGIRLGQGEDSLSKHSRRSLEQLVNQNSGVQTAASGGQTAASGGFKERPNLKGCWSQETGRRGYVRTVTL